MYVKDVPPIGAGRSERQAYLDRELQKLAEMSARVEERLDQQFRVWKVSGISSSFFYSTSTANTDPGATFLSTNTSQMSNWNRINLNLTDAMQQNIRELLGWLEPLDEGDYLEVVCTGKSGGGIYLITGPETVIGGAISIPVSWVGGNSSNPGLNDLMQLRI